MKWLRQAGNDSMIVRVSYWLSVWGRYPV